MRTTKIVALAALVALLALPGASAAQVDAVCGDATVDDAGDCTSWAAETRDTFASAAEKLVLSPAGAQWN